MNIGSRIRTEPGAATAAGADPRPLVSVIIPCFNEEANARRAYDAVLSVFEPLAGRYRLEIVFTDNHSTDGTFRELARIAADNPRVKVLRLARNFGFHRSVLTGYRQAAGDAAVQIDCDLQDPPSLIPEFLRLWEAGHDVVVGIRRHRKEPMVLRGARRLFYRLLRRISDDNLMDDAGDFRLVDRSILRQLRVIDDADPFLRGLISSLAANQIGVPYDRFERLHGHSKFPVRRLFGFAATGVVAHSMFPLRLATLAGLTVFAGTAVLAVYYVLAWAIGGRSWPEGFATTTLLLLIGIGLNGIFVGIVGEYVGRIYAQVRKRPLTVIERTINVDRRADEEELP